MTFVQEMITQVTGMDCEALEAFVMSQINPESPSVRAVNAYWDKATEAMQSSVLTQLGLDGGDADGVAKAIYFPVHLKAAFQEVSKYIEDILKEE